MTVSRRSRSNSGMASGISPTATGDQVLIEATGPNPAPALTLLRHDPNAAGLNGLDVRVSLIPASYQTLPTS